MPNKRKDFTDSQIMDALDAEELNVSRAAGRLGIAPNTLYQWIKKSPNLKGYLQMRTETDAVKARDKLNRILDLADELDPRQMGHIITICKILIDKQEADKQQLDVNQHTKLEVDSEIQDKIRKLLDE
jgi:transposase-like protein